MSDEISPDPAEAESAAGNSDSSEGNRTRILAGLLALAIVVVGVLAWIYGRDTGNAIARYRGAEITQADVAAILATDPSNPSPEDVVLTDQAIASEVTNFLRVEAVFYDLAAAGEPVSDEQLAASADTIGAQGIDPASDAGIALVRLDAAVAALTERVDTIVSEIPVDPPEWLCASHILVLTEEEALEVIDELEAGADFGELATERSTDPSASVNGGDLGCSASSRYVLEFTAGARAVGSGAISGPVPSQFGVHVIHVRAIGILGEDEFPELDDEAVAAGIESAAVEARGPQRAEVQTEVLSVVFADLADEVWVDPRIGEFDAVNAVVVPRAAG